MARKTVEEINKKYGISTPTKSQAAQSAIVSNAMPSVTNNRSVEKINEKYGVGVTKKSNVPASSDINPSIARLIGTESTSSFVNTTDDGNSKKVFTANQYTMPEATAYRKAVQEANAKRAIEQAKAEAEKSTLAGITRNVYGGMVGSFVAPVGTALNRIQGNPINTNASYYNLTKQADAAQQALQNKAADAIGAEEGTFKRTLSDLAVGSGLSVLQTAARLPLASVGKASNLGNTSTFVGKAIRSMTSLSLGSLQAGLSAGTSAMLDAKQRGGTDKQAVALGLLQGINEGLFESWSLGNLVEDKAAKNIGDVIKYSVAQMAAEGSEEAFTDIGNEIADRFVMAEKSSFNNTKKQYMDMGFDEKTAKKNAYTDLAKQVLASFVGGALAGAALGGAGSLIDTGVTAASALGSNPTTEFNNVLTDTNVVLNNQNAQDAVNELRTARENIQNKDAQGQKVTFSDRYANEKATNAVRDAIDSGDITYNVEDFLNNKAEQQIEQALPLAKPGTTDNVQNVKQNTEQNTTQNLTNNTAQNTTQNIVQNVQNNVQNDKEERIQQIADYMLKGNADAAENVNVSDFTDEDYEAINTLIGNNLIDSNVEQNDDVKAKTIEDIKEAQNRIIQETNPATDDIHSWVRSVDDIGTFEEEIQNLATGNDFTQADAQKALETGKVTVYSSKPIENGVWVTPSRMEAQNYAGDGKVYSKTVNVSDVAWLKGSGANEGQLAVTNGVAISDNTKYDNVKPLQTAEQVAEKVKGENNVRRNNISDEGSERNVPQRESERGGSIQEEGRRLQKYDRRAADEEFRESQRISEENADEVIPDAAPGQKVYKVKESTKAVKEARRLAEEKGVKNVVFFASDSDVKTVGGEEARAFYDAKTDTIGVRVNDEAETADRLIRHELTERAIARGEIDVNEVIDTISESVDGIDDIVERYFVGDSDSMSEQEFIKAVEAARKELVCDTLAGINQFKSLNTWKDLVGVMDNAISATQDILKNVENNELNDNNHVNDSIQHSVELPYKYGTKAADEWISTITGKARETLDMFSELHSIGQKNKASVMVDVGEKRHSKTIDVTTRNMLAQEWNSYVDESKTFAKTAKLLADALPEKIRKNANITSSGKIVPTPFEESFKMQRSFMQRIVDALPETVSEKTVNINGKEFRYGEGKEYKVGGEEYRQELLKERRKLYKEGKLGKKSIGGLSKDTWGTMGFLATNTKTVASGDFTTFCPQMYYNKGCWYCYRLSALKSGVNNKLVGEKVWYTGEILRLKQEDIDNLNKTGGLRIQSFGDWMGKFTQQFADMLQDAETVGLQIKVITKEPSMISAVAFLKEHGLGAKNLYFNISADYTIEEVNGDAIKLINPERPYLHKDGKTYWKRALTVEEANELRKQYPWVNTRIVATNTDEFIRGLEDPWVDVVTGYHGKERNQERISSETGETIVNVEPLGDNGMPVFSYDTKTNTWKRESEGKTKLQKALADKIEENGLQYNYYVKTCCQTGRCALCEGKCGKLARDFNIKNETNRSKDDIKYWQKNMMANPEVYKFASVLTNEEFQEIRKDYVEKNIQHSSRIADRKAKANFGSMFSGGGTFDYAIRNMINKEFAVEYNQQISAVFKENNGEDIFVGDVRDAIKNGYLEDKNIDYFHASPVCCNYSNQKTISGETELDVETAKAVAKAIGSTKPKIVTIENVKGYKNSEAVDIVKEALNKNGYTFDEGVYRASDYGAATIRERYFIRAVHGAENVPPMPKHKKSKTWYQVTKDLIEDSRPMPFKAGGYLEGRWNEIKDSVDTSKPVLVLRGTKGGSVVYAEANQPSPTIIARDSEARIVMPDGRVLEVTPRMIARIQGLPDTFKLPKQKGTAIKVLGNGVPVELTQAVAGSLLTQVDGIDSVKFSTKIKDREYMKAVDSGDTETAQRMVDESAKNAGYVNVGYHGTNYKFNSFDPLKAKDGRFGRAFYFSTDEADASDYGETSKYYVKANSPLKPSDFEKDLTEKELTETGKIITGNDNYNFKGYVKPNIGHIFENAKNKPNRNIYKALNYLGYDSIITDDGIIAVFDPEQIKSADPVTYDDSGNVIPLSDRFNDKRDDIRYSTKIKEQEEQEELTKEKLPVKARLSVSKAQTKLMNQIKNVLSATRFEDPMYLRGITNDIVNEVLSTGDISSESVSNLFDQMVTKGRESASQITKEYQDARQTIKGMTLDIPVEIQKQITDFGKRWVWNNSRYINMAVDDGSSDYATKQKVSIDKAYQSLREQYPTLFDYISAEADQLERIIEVSMKGKQKDDALNLPNDEISREYQYREFEDSVGEFKDAVLLAKRYAIDKTANNEVSTDDVVKAFYELKGNKRAYEKAMGENLLTSKDKSILKMLLNGEMGVDEIDTIKGLNHKGIKDVYNAQKAYNDDVKTITKAKKQIKQGLMDEAEELLDGSEKWKDKKIGLLYDRETAIRNFQDVMPEDIAETMIGKYLRPISENEADSNRSKNFYRDRVRQLDISRKIAKGNTNSESYAVQFIGEAQDNKRRAEANGKQYGKTAEEWQKDIDDFWKANPYIDKTKINNAISEFSTIYKELREKANEVLIRNGYEPIAYREGYFPHFMTGESDSLLAKFKSAFGIGNDVTALPTEINGLTENFKPGHTWFGNMLSRMGFKTEVDAVQGFDNYLQSISDIIYHTDNIMRLRALASQIRYRSSDKAMQERINSIKANDELTWEQQQDEINRLFGDNPEYALSRFVVWLDEYTNQLANKKSKHDRKMEERFGREAYNLLKAFEGNVAGNMVAMNVSSALTNVIPITQAFTTTEGKYLLKGMIQTLKGETQNDGLADRSNYITNRFGSESLIKSYEKNDANPKGLAKATQIYAATLDKIPNLMEIVDRFATESIVRGRYLQNIDKGMTEEQALMESDEYTAGLQADRSKGSMPTLFGEKNPISKTFTMFQLEVNNQFSWMFKDVPKELKDKALGAIALSLFKFLVGTYLFNDVYEYFIGRRPALDPLNMVNDIVGDATGYKIPNSIDLATGRKGFKAEKKDIYTTAENALTAAVEELPFVGGLLGGGRVPISSALPDVKTLAKTLLDEETSKEKKKETVKKELAKPLLYSLVPGGGSQIKKTYEGIKATSEGGSYTIDKTGARRLQYPIFNDSTAETAGNYVRGALFGKSSFPTARDWVEAGFNTYGARQTAVYDDMVSSGMSGREAKDVVDNLYAIQKTETDSRESLQRDYIYKSDLSDSRKSTLYFDTLASEKEEEILSTMEKEKEGAYYNALMAYKYADGSGNKAEAIAKSNLTDDGKESMYLSTVGSDDRVKTEKKIDEARLSGVSISNYLMGKKINEEVDGKTNKYEAVYNSKYTDKEKVGWLYSSGRTETSDYKIWTGSDSDFIKYKAYLDGLSGDGKQEKVIEYIKKQPERYWKELWEMAGYKETTFEKNFTDSNESNSVIGKFSLAKPGANSVAKNSLSETGKFSLKK